MDKRGSFWFLAGVGAGTLVGMLYAPLAGVRTRAIALAKAKQAQRFFAPCRREADVPASQAERAAERISRALDARRGTFHGPDSGA